MWESSLGIIVVILVMLGIALLASSGRGVTHVRSHQESTLASSGTAASNLNAGPVTGTAVEQATTKGVSLGVSLRVNDAPPTPAERSVGGR